MKLSSILAIAGGIVGLAAGGDTASQIASGAAIVSGVAGATGHSDVAKIAGIAALGAGAYSAFSDSGSSDAAQPKPDASSSSTASTAPTGIDGALSGDRGNSAISDNLGGPSGTGQSFSDAKQAAIDGTDYNGGLPGASNTPAPSMPTAPVASAPTAAPIVNTKPSAGTGTSAGGGLLDYAKGVGGFLKDNKELVNLASGTLTGMFGPQAQQTSLLEQRLKMQQDEINRQNANSNNVVTLKNPVTVRPPT